GWKGVGFALGTAVGGTPGEGRQVSILAKSSPRSWVEQKPYNIDPRRDWREETVSLTGPYTLMVQVNGKLPSHFAQEGQASESGLLAESQSEARVIAAGGSSLFSDDFMARP